MASTSVFEHPWLAQTGRFPIYTAVPHQHAVSFADTGQPNHGVIGPAATSQVRGLAKGSKRTSPSSVARYSGGIDLLTIRALNLQGTGTQFLLDLPNS